MDFSLDGPVQYRAKGGTWRKTFAEAVNDCGDRLTWDVGGLLGIVGRNHVLGSRTVFAEIQRRPWLSALDRKGEPVLLPIPHHGRYWIEPERAALELESRMLEECRRATSDRDRVYILLSGGLDSRIVAGVVASLRRSGELAKRPIGVTWGLDDSRDVVYGRRVAEILDFEWVHVPITETDLLDNVEMGAPALGALVGPTHLHRLSWLKSVGKKDIVLAGSYGDSVGRAEFSGFHVLGLPPMRPANLFGLIDRRQLGPAHQLVQQDLEALWQRAGRQPGYVHREHEQIAYYMRNMLAHAMSVAGPECEIYQMFTAHEVYGFMWSIHPAARSDNIYARLLENLDARIARLPWARTNRALRGRTHEAVDGLRRNYHNYPSWISGALFPRLRELADPDWLARTGVFDRTGTRDLANAVRRDPAARGRHAAQIHERFAWLASLRILAEQVHGTGRIIEPPCGDAGASAMRAMAQVGTQGGRLRDLRRAVLNTGWMRPVQRQLLAWRQALLKRRALRAWPPETWPGP